MKYIDADELINFVREWRNNQMGFAWDAVNEVLKIITSIQQEQPEFPTTDEEVEKALASIPKVELPDKYKTADWLFKQQEQPNADIEREIDEHSEQMPMSEFTHESEAEEFIEWAKKEFRHFYELGLNARKEETK